MKERRKKRAFSPTPYCYEFIFLSRQSAQWGSVKILWFGVKLLCFLWWTLCRQEIEATPFSVKRLKGRLKESNPTCLAVVYLLDFMLDTFLSISWNKYEGQRWTQRDCFSVSNITNPFFPQPLIKADRSEQRWEMGS